MFPPDIRDLARKLIDTCGKQKKKIAVAESCTGGLVAGALTEIPGSSAVFERGFVTYSNEAKAELLVIPMPLIESKGAVSAEVAERMAQGAIEHSLADIAVSVTGIAGPDGGTPEKPVGLVYLGLATRGGAVFHYQCNFRGSRDEVRIQTVREALRLLLSIADDAN